MRYATNRSTAALALVLAAACSATKDAAAPPLRPELGARLIAEWEATEDVCRRLAHAEEVARSAEVRVEPEQLYLQLARQQSLGASALESVFDEIGWPTPALVGQEAHEAALALVVNAPPESELPARAQALLEGCPDFVGRDEALAKLRDPAARTSPSAWIAPAPPAAEIVEPDAAGAPPAPELPHAALAAELVAMQARDQEVRYEFAAALRAAKGRETRMATLLLVARQKVVDAENLARLKEIVAEIGWPTADLVGREGARAAWLLAQHADSDPEFQDRVLAWIKPLAGTPGVPYADVALLTDRVRVARGEPQRFGTQWLTKPIDGVVHFGPSTPIEDREHVDERRALVGLPPLDEYLGTLREVYGVPEDAPELPAAR